MEQKREAEIQTNTKPRHDKRQKAKHDKCKIQSLRPKVDYAEDGEILSDQDIKKSKETALKYLHRKLDPKTGKNQANVCIIRDCFILSTQKLKRLNMKQLRVHADRLGVDQYVSFYKIDKVPTSLCNYYKVPGFP